jgi:hypothetical protein
MGLPEIISDVETAGWLDTHFIVGTYYERATPLAEKNAAYQTSQYVMPRGAIFLGSGVALSQEVRTVKYI